MKFITGLSFFFIISISTFSYETIETIITSIEVLENAGLITTAESQDLILQASNDNIPQINYPSLCVKEISKDWGSTPTSNIVECKKITNKHAFRCVVAIVLEWGSTSTIKLTNCSNIKTAAQASCVEDIASTWERLDFYKINTCSNM